MNIMGSAVFVFLSALMEERIDTGRHTTRDERCITARLMYH